MVFNAFFNNISVISWRPVHLSISLSQYSAWYTCILSKPLAAFPHNHCRNNGQGWERNKSCCNDYHQSSGRIFAEPGIEPLTSGSQVLYATDWATGLGIKGLKCNQLELKIILTLSQTSAGFYVFAVEIFWKHCEKRRNCSLRVFSIRFENFLPFLSNLI